MESEFYEFFDTTLLPHITETGLSESDKKTIVGKLISAGEYNSNS